MLPATTSCNTQSSVLEDGQNNCPKHVELTGSINKPLLLHLVGCLYYLYQWCTIKQISDNEIYLLIKYIKNVLWRVAKRLSNIQDARCLKVNSKCGFHTPTIFMRNTTNKCIYRYVDLLYYKQRSPLHVYTTINLLSVNALVGRNSQNESSEHGHESSKNKLS